MTSDATNLYTDRQHLSTVAYSNSDNLLSRVNIYNYQQPMIDFIGWALDQVAWDDVGQVLDVGCGPGLYLQRLARMGKRQLIGLDLSPGMLADARTNWDQALPRPLLAVADAQKLPLPTASCERVLAMHMLYHVPDMVRATHELRRVLCPGGSLLVATGGINHLDELSRLYHTALTRLSGQAVAFERPMGRFALENGAEVLRQAFAQVERRDITSTLVIPDAEPVLRYIQSSRPIREASLLAGVMWDDVMIAVEDDVLRIIREQGALRVGTHAGVFVCR